MPLASVQRSTRPVTLTMLILFTLLAQPFYSASKDMAAADSCVWAETAVAAALCAQTPVPYNLQS